MDTVAERIAYLLDHVWNGNRSAMGRDLGVTAAAIYKIVKGQQKAGGKVLAGLERHPKINARWVKTGDGEPLQHSVSVASREADRLPVLDRLLPGPPTEHEARIAGHELWVASSLVRSSRYLCRVRDKDPIVADAKAKIAAGDLLLIETEQFWFEDPSLLDQKTVVVRVPTPDRSHHLSLAVATIEGGHRGLTRPPGYVTLPDGGIWPVLPPSTSGSERSRGLVFDESLQATAKSGEEASVSVPVPIPLSEIRGLVMLLLRT